MVRKRGFEPPRPCGRQPLKPMRMNKWPYFMGLIAYGHLRQQLTTIPGRRTLSGAMAEAARRQTTETLQKLYDGKLRLERRNGGSKIYARTFVQGKSVIHSTGEVTIHAATKIATDWFLDLRDRVRKGED